MLQSKGFYSMYAIVEKKHGGFHLDFRGLKKFLKDFLSGLVYIGKSRIIHVSISPLPWNRCFLFFITCINQILARCYVLYQLLLGIHGHLIAAAALIFLGMLEWCLHSHRQGNGGPRHRSQNDLVLHIGPAVRVIRSLCKTP